MTLRIVFDCGLCRGYVSVEVGRMTRDVAKILLLVPTVLYSLLYVRKARV
jgi:hypothetical protein